MANINISLRLPGDPAARSFPIHPGWNYLLRSLGVHWWTHGPWTILRFSNGVAGQAGGGMYFDELRVIADEQITPMVVRARESVGIATYTIADGGGHYWMPRAVLTRRFRLGTASGVVPRVSRTIVPTGGNPLKFVGPYLAAAAGRCARIKASLASGSADPSVDMQFDAIGPWHPSGIHEGYAHGGEGTAPSPGYEGHYELLVLEADCARERNNIDLLSRDTGEPLLEQEAVDLEQYAYNRGRWGTDWCRAWPEKGYDQWQPKDWNTGTSPERAALLEYQLVDGEHEIRRDSADVGAAGQFDDPCCHFNLRVSVGRTLAAWSLARVASLATSIPIGALGRQWGWVTWCVAAARELAKRDGLRSDVARYDAWLDKAAQVYVRAQSSCGTWQVTASPWQNWSPSPQTFTTQDRPGVVQSVPTDRSLAQSHEHGILAAGAFAVWRQLPEGRTRTQLGNAIMRASDVHMGEHSPQARHWLVGRVGNFYPPECLESYGEWDTVYLWFTAAFANRVAMAQQPNALARIVRRALAAVRVRRSDPPVDRYLRALLKKSGYQPVQFVAQFSKPNETYTAFNVDPAIDMQEAIDRGWKP